MPCSYCDADVDGGCKGPSTAADCLSSQFRKVKIERDWLHRVLTRFVGSVEGNGTVLTDEQEEAYNDAATCLDVLDSLV